MIQDSSNFYEAKDKISSFKVPQFDSDPIMLFTLTASNKQKQDLVLTR